MKKKLFNIWYAVLSAQFHLRVIGSFIKIRNVLANPNYMQYMPRVAGYLRDELKNPLLKNFLIILMLILILFQNEDGGYA